MYRLLMVGQMRAICEYTATRPISSACRNHARCTLRGADHSFTALNRTHLPRYCLRTAQHTSLLASTSLLCECSLIFITSYSVQPPNRQQRLTRRSGSLRRRRMKNHYYLIPISMEGRLYSEAGGNFEVVTLRKRKDQSLLRSQDLGPFHNKTQE